MELVSHDAVPIWKKLNFEGGRIMPAEQESAVVCETRVGLLCVSVPRGGGRATVAAWLTVIGEPCKSHVAAGG